MIELRVGRIEMMTMAMIEDVIDTKGNVVSATQWMMMTRVFVTESIREVAITRVIVMIKGPRVAAEEITTSAGGGENMSHHAGADLQRITATGDASIKRIVIPQTTAHVNIKGRGDRAMMTSLT